jgi:hypothetical protein
MTHDPDDQMLLLRRTRCVRLQYAGCRYAGRNRGFGLLSFGREHAVGRRGNRNGSGFKLNRIFGTIPARHRGRLQEPEEGDGGECG